MVISVGDVRKRLSKYSSVLELEKEKDKERIYRILACIGKERNGIATSDLKKHLGKGNVLNFSNTHLIAFLGWLEERGYIIEGKARKRQKPKLLTDKGNRALQNLDEFLYSPETSLKIMLRFLDDREVEAKLEGNLTATMKTAVFSNEFVRDRVLELTAALLFLLKDIDLTITIPSMGHKSVLILLQFLWGFYWRKTSESGLGPTAFGPFYINMWLTDEEGKTKYCRFWKEHLEKHLKFKERPLEEYVISHGEKSLTRKRPLFPLLPSELENFLPILVKEAAVKEWIETQLEKDADWFMPHYVWVELGFRQRRKDLSLNSINHVSPPIFHETVSPKLPNEYGNFASMIRYMVRKDDEESYKALCLWIARAANWRRQDFYKSWRILRKEYEAKREEDPKFRDVADILDEAFREYVFANNNPNTNLESALGDYLISKDSVAIVNGIREGMYDLREEKEESLGQSAQIFE